MIEPRRSTSDEGENANAAPAWIVSFTDMITLLLSFFVMLQAFAHMQDPELFFIGRDSFRRAIAGLGLPNFLLGRPDKPRFEYRKRKHATDEAKDRRYKRRVISPEDQKIRQSFLELRRSVDIQSFNITASPLDSRFTPITFAPLEAELNAVAKQYLSYLARDLAGQLGGRSGINVYIIGMAADATTSKSQWVLSARRAAAVQEFLSRQIGTVHKTSLKGWRFSSWGAGAGGKWREQFGSIPEKSFIAVIVTGE